MAMVPVVPKVNTPWARFHKGLGKLRKIAYSVHENKLQKCHRPFNQNFVAVKFLTQNRSFIFCCLCLRHPIHHFLIFVRDDS